MKRCLWVLVGFLGAAWPTFAQDLSIEDRNFFEAKVRPLLLKHCFSCHSGEAKKQKGGLVLASRADLLKGGDTGPAVVPGQPEQSLLLKAVRYHPDLQMPPSGKLAERDIAALEEWVRRGVPFPGAGSTGVKTSALSLEEGRKFWSLQPLQKSPPPVVADKAWPRRPIDVFLLAEMEKRALKPSPTADRATLIRRASFDLIGLPPTPDEVTAFVKDPDPQAYSRLIDRLLASPHHGERWARYWLDLARYCDIPEPWAENKGQPYLYRDWVVRAINEDLPYDQFLRMQLAADLMPGHAPRDLAALGFIGLSPSYWKELKLAPEVIQAVVAEEWEERIQALTSTFLGLTVACARCHDHKFDPITTQDYYGLAGVFASTRLIDRAMLDKKQADEVQTARGTVKALQAELDKLKAKKAPAKDLDDVQKKIEDVKKATPHYDTALAPAVIDSSLHVVADGPHRTRLDYRPGAPQDVAVQVRGNPTNVGPVVPRRFLSVFAADQPRTFKQGSGRLELADALVNDARALTARVLVNRVWKHHFGRGLVETPSDFGTQGERPTHPQLLDDLASRFIDNGWSLKWLQREIMLSAAYQQVSTTAAGADSENRWLARMSRRRLDVEAWRDAMLAVSGTLNPNIGGPPQELSDPKNHRRTLYGTVKRRELNDMLRLHDFPDPTAHSPSRVPTTTPLQQLFTLNSPLMHQQAKALAQRVKNEAGDDTGRIQRAYWLLFGRAPSERQLQFGLDFLTGQTNVDHAWQQYAQVLLGSNEFLFID